MAGIKISALPAATIAQLTDVFPADQTPGPVTRKITLEQVLDLFQQSGVISLEGTQNEVLVNGTFGSPITGTAITLTTPQEIATTSTPTFNQLKLSGSILNPSGDFLLALSDAGASSENFVAVFNNTSGLPAIISSFGTIDANVDLHITSKAAGQLLLATTLSTSAISWTTGTAHQHVTNWNFTDTANTNTVTWQDSSGTLAYLSNIPSVSPSALTKVDDTNVTLTLGGTPSTALLQATSLTMGWSGVLSGTRGGTGVNNGASTFTMGGSHTLSGAFASTFTFTNTTSVTFPTSGTLATTSQLVTPAALTKTDDTNVTITLGGNPSTALVNAASLTMGWTGQLGLSRGGTNQTLVASNGGIVYSDASAMAILAGTATANQVLLSGASSAPTWSAFTFAAASGNTSKILRSDGTNWAASGATYPNTYTANNLLYASSSTAVTGLATANNGTLITSGAGVPSISSTLPAAVQANITKVGSQSQALNMNTNLINNVVDPVSAQDAATKNYVNTSISASNFPSGTVMLFVQTSAPTGWTKNVSTNDNSALRLVTGTAGTGGTVAFTTAFVSQSVAGTNSSYTLTIPDIPAHTHSFTGQLITPNLTSGVTPVTTQNNSSNTSGSTGGGGGHTHTFTGTAINLAVQYVDVIQCSKN